MILYGMLQALPCDGYAVGEEKRDRRDQRRALHHEGRQIMKMAKLNLFGSLGFIAISIMILSQCGSLGWGGFHEPGAGLYPGLLAISLIFTSVLLIVQSLVTLLGRRARQETRPSPEAAGDFGSTGFETAKMKRVGFVIVALLFSAIFFETLGFLLSTFLLILLIIKVVEREGWVLSVVISLGATVPPYIIFKFFLRVPLPSGLMSFF